MRQFLSFGVTLMALVACSGCSTVPAAPHAVGENYPGTCLPAELSWPTDFLESLPAEPSAVGGRIVGLRLESVDSAGVWRLRSADTKHDAAQQAGERGRSPLISEMVLVVEGDEPAWRITTCDTETNEQTVMTLP